MIEADYIIIGAGIAGASAAYELSKTGKVIILEKEDQPGYHSTGRSAAVFITTYKQGDPVIRALVLGSEDFLKNPPTGFTEHDIYKPRLQLYIGSKKEQDELLELYRKLIIVANSSDSERIELISREGILKLCPILNEDYSQGAILTTGMADLDVHALLEGYLKGARRRGCELLTGAEASSIKKIDKNWIVETTKGVFKAPVIINAAGAWVDNVARLSGVKEIGIKPLRRTMILLDPPGDYDVDSFPFIDDLHERFYFKPDAGKIIACPADQTLSEPCDAQPEEIDVAYAAHYFEQVTGINVQNIEHKWAGLRNRVEDGYPAVGFAPDAQGFFWLAGQEGYGIKTAPALARIASALINGGNIPEDIKAFGIDETLLDVKRLFN